MKEYKVVSWKMSFKNNNEKLEDVLNQYAKLGWVVRHISENTTRLVFERDKNR